MLQKKNDHGEVQPARINIICLIGWGGKAKQNKNTLCGEDLGNEVKGRYLKSHFHSLFDDKVDFCAFLCKWSLPLWLSSARDIVRTNEKRFIILIVSSVTREESCFCLFGGFLFQLPLQKWPSWLRFTSITLRGSWIRKTGSWPLLTSHLATLGSDLCILLFI